MKDLVQIRIWNKHTTKGDINWSYLLCGTNYKLEDIAVMTNKTYFFSQD